MPGGEKLHEEARHTMNILLMEVAKGKSCNLHNVLLRGLSRMRKSAHANEDVTVEQLNICHYGHQAMQVFPAGTPGRVRMSDDEKPSSKTALGDLVIFRSTTSAYLDC